MDISEAGQVATLGMVIETRAVDTAGDRLDRLGERGEVAAARVKTGFAGADAVFARLTAEAQRTSAMMEDLARAEAQAARPQFVSWWEQTAAAARRSRTEFGAVAPVMAQLSAATSRWSAGLETLARQQQQERQALDGMIASMNREAQAARDAAAMTAQLEQAHAGGATGAGRLENAITNLGVGLTGLPGPIGNVLDKLGGFLIGGGITAAVAVGIGAVTAAFLHFTAESRAATAAGAEAADMLRNDLATAAGTALGQVDALNRALAVAVEKESTLLSLNPAANLRAIRDYFTGVDGVAAEVTRLNNAAGQAGVALAKLRDDRAIEDLARQFGTIRSANTSGPLSIEGAAQLRAVGAAMRELQANGNLTLAQTERLRDLLGQVDATYRAGFLSPSTRNLGGIEVPWYALAQALETVQTRVQWFLKPADRNTIFADLTRTGATAETQATLTDAANVGGPSWAMLGVGGERGKSPLREWREDSLKLDNSWENIARSAIGFAQALGGAGQEMALLLNNAVTVVDQVDALQKKLASGKSLSAGDVFSVAGAGLGLLSSVGSLFGETEAARRQREVTEKNTEALDRLTSNVGNLDLNVTGNAFTAGQRAVSGLLGGGADFFALPNAVDTSAVNAFLKGQGTSLGDLKDLADALDITLNTDSFTGFVSSLQELDKALKATELTRFAETFGGRLEALTNQWRIFDTVDPVQKLTEQLRVAAGISLERVRVGDTVQLRQVIDPRLGSPALAAAAAGLDLSTKSGRDELLGNLQDLFLQLKSGSLGVDALGGLTPGEFLEQLGSLTDLLREIEADARARDEALQRTVETLRSFADSLRLDPALSPLSPAAQLAQARAAYQSVLSDALTGDQTAAARLPEVARTFLDLSRQFNASSPAYVADFSAVQTGLDQVADYFEGMRSTDEEALRAVQATATSAAALVSQGQTTNATLEALVAVQGSTAQALAAQIAALTAEVADLKATTRKGLEAVQV